MRITRENQDTTQEFWVGWHILTVAEAGFSMLDIYGRLQYGLDIEIISRFADQVNQRDEAGSLHPTAPISAIPRRFFREQEKSLNPTVLSDFKRQIADFLGANRTTIYAQKILVDFHVCSAPVPRRYVDATEEVFQLNNQDFFIKDVVLFT